MGLRNEVKHGVTYGMNFSEWEAAIAAGATLAELLEWETDGAFPMWFKAKVVAWYRLHNLVQAHIQEAAMPKRKPKG